MNVSLENTTNQLKTESVPALINTVGTGALTYAGQFFPQLVEYVAMAPEALALGSVLTSLAGSATNVLGRTFAPETYQNKMIQVAAYAVAAFATGYFLADLAAMARMSITFEKAMRLSTVTTVINAIQVFWPESKPVKKDETKPEELKKMKAEDFAKIQDKTFSNEESQKITAARKEIDKADYKWDATKYDEVVKANKDGKFDIEEYKKVAEKKEAA